MKKTVRCSIDVFRDDAVEHLKKYFDVVEETGLCTAVEIEGCPLRIRNYLIAHGYEDVTAEVYPELF